MFARRFAGATPRSLRSKFLIGAAVTLVAGMGAGVGSLIMAGATTTDIYYACLRNGTLSGVNTSAPPACKSGRQIQWNEQGPAPTPGPQTIYSATFTPFMRMPDGDALQHFQYVGPSGYGPGAYPNVFTYNGGTGHDAFFNTPDVTIGATPMSAVSAQVCLEFVNGSGNGSAGVYLGVQDKDHNVTVKTAAVTASAAQQCPTLTFDHPVQLVNQPHLVTVVDLRLKTTADTFFIEGVTYNLQPTQAGDITPGS